MLLIEDVKTVFGDSITGMGVELIRKPLLLLTIIFP